MKKISKTDYVQSLKCMNVVWHRFHDRSKLPDLSNNLIVQMGTEFGNVATKHFPKGVMIDVKYSEASKETEKYISLGIPIFEATFETEKLYCKVDILEPSTNGFDIIEVKSSSSVKKAHYDDIAFQKHILKARSLVPVLVLKRKLFGSNIGVNGSSQYL